MAIFGTSPEWYSSDGTLKDIDTEISKIASGETTVGKANVANQATVADKVTVPGGYASILDAVYPIGSIYMSVSPNNPGSLFGGTWEAWGSGRVPVGVNTNDNDFKTVEKTGGNKSAELPWHFHRTFAGAQGASTGVEAMVGGDSSGVQVHTDTAAGTGNDANGYLITVARTDSRYSATNLADTSGTGKSNASNLQPYITCYMWKRTV